MKLKKDRLLAELIGMVLGDGNLGNYLRRNQQGRARVRCHYLRIYCNLKEKQYAEEIQRLLRSVFGKKPYQYERPKLNVLYLEISLRNLDTLLDLPIGDKMTNEPVIPKWIFAQTNNLRACLRGLFDTDGCCYRTGGKYRIINFTNKNQRLLTNIYDALKLLQFHPYQRGEKNIELGRQQEVDRFFDEITPRNRKHYRYNAGVANLVTARV